MPKTIQHIIVDGVEHKPCSCCKENKPLTEYIRSKQNSDGLHVYCNKCRRNKKHEEYLRHSDVYKNRAKKFYNDNLEAVLVNSAEYRKKNADRIKATSKAYRESHKAEKALTDKRYREENREYLQNRRRELRKNPKYKEQHKIRNQRYNSTENGRKVKQMSCERYRARKEGTSATLTKLQWRLCKEFFFHCCAYCGKPLENLTQDHFIPVSEGGGYDVDNIIPCCKSCNGSKQNKEFNEWYESQDFYDKYRKQRILEYLALFK